MVESKKTQAVILLFILFLLTIMAKAINAGVNHITITHAIYAYQMECIDDGEQYRVTGEGKEEFSKTMFRWWDWGHKRILSEEDYRIIRPYIGKLTSADFVGKYFE